jgi:hypothetical protein
LKYDHTDSGCPVKDSIQMIVNGRPNLETNLQLDSQCNTFSKLTLRAKVNGTSNPNIIWEGEYVYRNILNLDSIPFNSSESVKNYTIKYSYQDPYTTCESFDSTIVSVQAQASLNIMLDTLRSVYDSIIPLRAEGVFVNEILWSTAGDGNFTSNNKLLTQYKQGTYDKKIGGSILYLESRNNGACRVVKDSLILEIFPLSLKQNEFNSIKIYPSPTAANFSIELPHDFTLGTLRIVGLDGKLVKEFMVNKDNRIFTEDISSIPTGIYFIELVSKEGIYNGKIMKR